MTSLDPNFTSEAFLCPNCGSTEGDIGILVSVPFDAIQNNSDPWAGVLEWQRCQQCGKSIPAHIAERWNGMTIEQAKQEWQEGTKKDQEQQLNDVVQRFYDAFGYWPFFDGLSMDLMMEDVFIKKLNHAIENNDPEIDLSDYFPNGRNL